MTPGRVESGGQGSRDARVALGAARRLTRLGAAEPAAAAWRTLLALDPHHVEARCRLAEAELYDLAGAVPGRRPRVAVIGNCQAHGVADRLRRLCPGAEVRGYSVGEVSGPEDAESLALRLADVDVVVSHPLGARHGPLSTARLAADGRRLVRFPRIHFDGLQPDMVPAGAYPRGMHSQLVLAGFAMGLPEERTAGLFNAYVYGALGYFDAWSKAEAHLIEGAAQAGFDVASMLAEWRRDGAFMHAPVHPGARVLGSLAEEIARRLGLTPDAATDEAPDLLEPLGVWPVYPEIARRLGHQGGLIFRFRDEPPMGLEQMIARGYRLCAAMDAARIAESAAPAVAILRREGI